MILCHLTRGGWEVELSLQCLKELRLWGLTGDSNHEFSISFQKNTLIFCQIDQHQSADWNVITKDLQAWQLQSLGSQLSPCPERLVLQVCAFASSGQSPLKSDQGRPRLSEGCKQSLSDNNRQFPLNIIHMKDPLHPYKPMEVAELV